jgi:hypothetical protein
MTDKIWTVKVYPAKDREPVVYVDIVAPDPNSAVEVVGLGWPPKRLVRSCATIEQEVAYYDHE